MASKLQSAVIGTLTGLFWFNFCFCFVVVPVESQLLHPVDMIALRAIKSNMHDLPGGAFFTTWIFALRINPCMTFTGVQCVKIGSFNRVISLKLGMNSSPAGLGGSLPAALGDLAYLQSLVITPGSLQGAIPDTIGTLQNLRVFSVSSNSLSGWIPASLGGLPLLRELVLSNNRLSGPVPGFRRQSSSFSSLLHLDVRNNDLLGPFPELPSSVTYLSVTKNRLSGSVVVGLEGMTGLSYLDLSHNEFSGRVPSFVFEYSLSFLLLNHNQFRGAVSVPSYVSIPVVDLSHNHLQGIISPYLAGTQSLFLNNNLFFGTVPQDFASKMQEASMQSLYLQHNYLTNSGALGDASLPPSVAVCLQYNCMVPPRQSLCPTNADMPASRPEYQCQRASNGSPGD